VLITHEDVKEMVNSLEASYVLSAVTLPEH